MFAGYFKHVSQAITLSSTVSSGSETLITNDGYFVVERINPVISYLSNLISNAEVTFKFQRANRYLSDNAMPLNAFFNQNSTYFGSLERGNGKPLFILQPAENIIITLSYPSLIGGQANLSVNFEFEGYYVSADNFRIDNSGLNKALVYALID